MLTAKWKCVLYTHGDIYERWANWLSNGSASAVIANITLGTFRHYGEREWVSTSKNDHSLEMFHLGSRDLMLKCSVSHPQFLMWIIQSILRINSHQDLSHLICIFINPELAGFDLSLHLFPFNLLAILSNTHTHTDIQLIKDKQIKPWTYSQHCCILYKMA